MPGIEAIGSHVDFIALHCYGQRLDDVEGSVADNNAYIEGVYAKYQLPIWLTETAMATWQGSEFWLNGCYPTESVQAGFAAQLVNMLESLDPTIWERHSYFVVGGD